MKSDDIKYGSINLDLGFDYSQDLYLELRRFKRSEGSTIAPGCIMGVLLIDNVPVCYTQERSQYAITTPDPIMTPQGHEVSLTYSAQIAGKRIDWWNYFKDHYADKSKLLPYEVPEIMVHGRAGLRFHPGTDYLWSKGCVICGSYSNKSKFTTFDAPDRVWASAQVWAAVYPTLLRHRASVKSGTLSGSVYLDITNSGYVWDPGTPPPEFYSNLIQQ